MSPMAIVPAEIRRTDLHDAIMKALRVTYEVNQDRHDPTVGDTTMTFGLHTWTSSTFYLQREVANVEGATWTVVNQSLEIKLGRCRLRIHKLGSSEADDASQSFPDHAGPAARMGRFVQLALDLGMDEIEPLDWVIGHYGSAEEGLRAVRLQAVGSERSQDGRITRWSAILPIYEAGGAPLALTVIEGEQPDAVPIPEPEIALKPSGDQEADRGQPS
jgi:hypothetical protein